MEPAALPVLADGGPDSAACMVWDLIRLLAACSSQVLLVVHPIGSCSSERHMLMRISVPLLHIRWTLAASICCGSCRPACMSCTSQANLMPGALFRCQCIAVCNTKCW